MFFFLVSLCEIISIHTVNVKFNKNLSLKHKHLADGLKSPVQGQDYEAVNLLNTS